MKLTEQKIDPVMLEQGAWVRDIPEMGDLRLKTRGTNNRDWRRMQARLIEAVPRKKKVGGRIDPDEQDRINAILLRETALLDWRNMEDDEGNLIPFSKETAGKLLSDPKLSKFRDACIWAAVQVAEIGEAEIEDDAKN